MQNKEKVIQFLEFHKLPYEIMEHPEVFNMEEMDQLDMDPNSEITKTLFIRDKKKKRYFLVVIKKNKYANLNELQKELRCNGKLGLASAEDLLNKIQLVQGSVSPFGVINDKEHKIEVIIDSDVMSQKRVGLHPNDNSCTVWIEPQLLKWAIETLGNQVTTLKL